MLTDMKKMKYIIGLGLSLFLASCTDALDLQPKSDLTQTNFFNKTSDVELALVGCYDGLQQMSLNHDYVLMEMRSDLSSSYLAEGEFGYIDTFVKDIVESGDVYNYWKACFNALSRTNLVIDNLGIVNDEVTRNRIEGEARFIRALVYFNMVRLWGDLPIITRLASDYSSIFSESTKWNSEILFAVQFNSTSGEGQTFSYDFSVFGGNSGLNTPTTPFAEECESDVVRSQTNLMEEDKAGIWIVCGKYLKRGTKPSQKDNAADAPILRYADVLLMYVEAVLGAPSEPYANDITNDVNALAVYNAVRARAGHLPVTSVSRNELLQERKFEFAFENQRWFDLQRVVGVSETIRIMEAHGQDSRLLPKQKFTKVERFQMLYPIPGREIRLLGKEILSQNEGYN